DPEANIIFGSTFDQSLEGKVRISVVATGIEAMAGQMPRPVALSLVANAGRSMVPSNQATERSDSAPVPVPTVASQPAPSVGRRDIVGATALAMPSANPAMAAPQPSPVPAMMPPVVAEAPRAVSQPLAAPQAIGQPAASQPAPQL